MNEKNVNLVLLLVAILWGLGITVTKIILDGGVGVFTFIFIRFLIGAITLAFFYKKIYSPCKKELLLGVGSGCFLFTFFGLQTIGLSLTSVGNTAIYTATTALLTPFVALLLVGRRIQKKELVAGLLLIMAIYINNLGSISNLAVGDVFVLLSALMLSVNVCVMSRYMNGINVARVTFISLLTCSLLGLVGAIATSETIFTAISFKNIICFLYLGILTTAFAFVVQNKAVLYTREATISFILATEAVWGILFACIIYKEVISINLVLALGLLGLGFWLVSGNKKINE